MHIVLLGWRHLMAADLLRPVEFGKFNLLIIGLTFRLAGLTLTGLVVRASD